MADLSAGALTVSIDADLTKLEKGLDKAQSKVAQSTQELDKMSTKGKQAAEETGGGFFEATGKVQEFQSKLSAALGVIAGFAAAAELVAGVARGFTKAGEAIEGSKDSIDALDKGFEAFIAEIPILNKFAEFGKTLAIGLGLATDEAKELEQALKQAAAQQKVFDAFAKARVSVIDNEIKLAQLQGKEAEAARLQAQKDNEARLQAARELRQEARRAQDEDAAGAEVLRRNAAELEKQAREILEIEMQRADELQKQAALIKAQAMEAERVNYISALDSMNELRDIIRDVTKLRFDESGFLGLKPFEELTKKINDEFDSTLQQARELAKTLDDAGAQKLLNDLMEIEDQFDKIDVRQEAVNQLARIQIAEFREITEELEKQADAAELDLDQLEQQRELAKIQEEFAKKREELEERFRGGRLEGIRLTENEEKVLADALAELDRTERARVAAVLAGEKEITKEKKKQLAITDQTFATGFGESVFIRKLPAGDAAQDAIIPVQAPDVGPLQTPDIDLAALTGTVQTAEDSVASILQAIFNQDSDRNTLLRDIRTGINKLQTVGGGGTSRAFT
ncbi:MAG: hypothetical protein ACYTCN_00495 [Planctomycetota bacterium]|jgi:hypothetical protein